MNTNLYEIIEAKDLQKIYLTPVLQVVQEGVDDSVGLHARKSGEGRDLRTILTFFRLQKPMNTQSIN